MCLYCTTCHSTENHDIIISECQACKAINWHFETTGPTAHLSIASTALRRAQSDFFYRNRKVSVQIARLISQVEEIWKSNES